MARERRYDGACHCQRWQTATAASSCPAASPQRSGTARTRAGGQPSPWAVSHGTRWPWASKTATEPDNGGEPGRIRMLPWLAGSARVSGGCPATSSALAVSEAGLAPFRPAACVLLAPTHPRSFPIASRSAALLSSHPPIVLPAQQYFASFAPLLAAAVPSPARGVLLSCNALDPTVETIRRPA